MELQDLKGKKKNEFNNRPKDTQLENPLDKDFKQKLEEVIYIYILKANQFLNHT